MTRAADDREVAPPVAGRWTRWWSTRGDWGAAWSARVVATLGVLSVVSAVFPPVRHRLEVVVQVLPDFTPGVAAGATAAAGVILVGLSTGLRRRKRRAWQVAVAATGVLTLTHLVKGLDVEEATLSTAVLGLLLVTRPAFTGASDPRTRRHVVVVFAATLSAVIVAGTVLVLADAHRLVGAVTPGRILQQVLWGLVGAGGPLQFNSVRAADRIATTLLLLGATVVALTLSAALRPAGGPHPLREAEAADLRGLLARHGDQDSLGYFALRDDKSAVFSSSGKAAVAFRVVSGVSLAGGDPLGDREAWPAAIAAWLEQARAYAWVPAVLAASEAGAQAYHRAGLDALELGDEAVLQVDEFTLDGRPMRGVRQTVSRLERKGYTVQVDRVVDIPIDELADLTSRADAWRDGAVERGFSMALGRFADPRDPDVVVVRCRDAEGSVRGLLALVPWGSEGLSLDLMRRSPDADNGVVELMVTTLVGQAPAMGVTRVSLNFAVFRAVFERGGRLGAGPMLRLWHRVLLLASRFWQIESLYRANAKYRPAWEPRFLCFERARDLPRIGAAALQAEAFLTPPRWFPGRR